MAAAEMLDVARTVSEEALAGVEIALGVAKTVSAEALAVGLEMVVGVVEAVIEAAVKVDLLSRTFQSLVDVLRLCPTQLRVSSGTE